MKKLVSVLVAMVFLVCQTTSVGAYGDHDEGTMGYPNSITYKLDNSISANQKAASATTWTSVPTGTDTYVSAHFLWKDPEDFSSGSIYQADGRAGAVTVSPPSLMGETKVYYCVSSYHSVAYNGGTYMNTLYTYIP